MRSCHDQQAAYLERDPEAREHVPTCPVCSRAQPELDGVLDLLAEDSAWAGPSPALEGRLMAAVHADDAAATDPVAPSGPVIERDAARPGWALWRRRWVPVAVAVGAAAVVGGVVVSSGDDRVGVTYGLVATDQARSARGTVTVRSTPSGDEFKLDLRGLPRAEQGSFYQAWVRSSAGGLVPIGSFHTGDGEIVLWSGVDTERYPTLTVTLEPEDDNQASSGARVLTADLRRAP